MGIANYTNLSELLNKMMEAGARVSIADLVSEALRRGMILASEGTLADKADLENGFIALVDTLVRTGAIKPVPADETESTLIQLYESGKLAENGYGGNDGDRFLEIQWAAVIDELPVITNISG
jgi:hypothetical protein